MEASGKQGGAATGGQDIQLGFVENAEAWKLISRFFPTKVGGKPAWLDLKNLPPPEMMKCFHCDAPYAFLCQIYAPIEEKDSCFHRTIFLFICKNPACSQEDEGGIVALRCQLPLDNEFYPDTPFEERPVVGKDEYGAEHYMNICAVCGCLGSKQCAGCKKVHYCGKAHQTIDWKMGHKQNCKEVGRPGDGSSKFLLPEADVVIEEEPADAKKREKTDEEKMADYATLVKDKIESLPDADVGELDKMASSGGDDPVFTRFRKRVAREPEQVVRYWRGGAPLWVSSRRVPAAADVPACRCGAARQFEFQVLPQLLNHLDLDETGDSVDWGTLAVYTCSDSCQPPAGEPAYAAEVVWKQQL
ncbi:programmed cell death protein 2-like [Pollicipes pollicipes]|uniref:programmed cell death protein 2-like n=1 Tax=Pollicipes pollicipes TaxID=41117 RepID=UPI0018856913|nr:programmed cell death protein 2-like [Pollicipes pollicipes]XP_037076927.1 programmed cell death protein 2-like [Pollicipes pollicipes]